MSASATPEGDLRERLLAAVRAATKPLSLSAIGKLIKAKDTAFLPELEALLNANHLYRWPEYRRSQYFWHISPEQKAREAILLAAAEVALSKTDLSKKAAKSLPGFSEKRVEASISLLLAEKQLQAVPAFSSNTKLLICPGARDAYWLAGRLFLEKKMRSAGFEPGEFPNAPIPRHNDAPALLLEAVRTLEPVPGVPVSTLRLRNHFPNMPKHEFDSAALELRKRQDVFLSQHADPYNISAQDKDLLIDGQDGTYYVAIALR